MIKLKLLILFLILLLIHQPSSAQSLNLNNDTTLGKVIEAASVELAYQDTLLHNDSLKFVALKRVIRLKNIELHSYRIATDSLTKIGNESAIGTINCVKNCEKELKKNSNLIKFLKPVAIGETIIILGRIGIWVLFKI